MTKKDDKMELTEDVFFQLDEILAANGSEESMIESSELHGFFTAVISSGVELSKDVELDAIWAVEKVEWKTPTNEAEFDSIITAMKDEIKTQLATVEGFEPLFSEFEDDDGKTLVDVELWCEGYCLAVELFKDDWKKLIDAEHKGLNVITLFGTEAGHAVLDLTPDKEIERLAHVLPAAAIEVFETFQGK